MPVLMHTVRSSSRVRNILARNQKFLPLLFGDIPDLHIQLDQINKADASKSKELWSGMPRVDSQEPNVANARR